MKAIIPWDTSTTNELRRRNLEAVQVHLETAGLEPALYSCEPFTPSRARNLGALEHGPGDVLLFVDADSIVPADQLHQAIDLAGDEGGLVYAYELYLSLTESGTQGLLDGDDEPFAQPYESRYFGPPSVGAICIRFDDFRRVGGFDERFGYWGYEDVEFAQRCQRELGPIRRVPGLLQHLWHGPRFVDTGAPEEADPLEVQRNRLLLEETAGITLSRRLDPDPV